jgi:CRISPR-associated protein Csd2
LHPIVSLEHTVTRCAVTTPEEAEEQEGGNRTMGRKFAVPYALYRVHGFINPNLAGGANGTGFSEADLELLKQALDRMFEADKSAARANMRPVACIAFRHESPLGNARADQLFARVTCLPKPGVQSLPGDDGAASGEGRPPRSFRDYQLRIDQHGLPGGVSLERWIDWIDAGPGGGRP